jgi:hypothetical protein
MTHQKWEYHTKTGIIHKKKKFNRFGLKILFIDKKHTIQHKKEKTTQKFL